MRDFPLEVAEHLEKFHVVSVESDLVTQSGDIFPFFSYARRHNINYENFRKWINEADYENSGPSWWTQFAEMHERKMLEHYASIELADILADRVYMDAAASASPFYKVIIRTHGAAKCYRQDLNRRTGVHGDTIGSDASAIPLPDASLDGIVSHNSWEHFEGESAFGFIAESQRLLRVGGKLCILPINFREKTEIWTSPSCWATKYANAKDFPKFDPSASIVLKEDIVQRQVMWWNPAELAARLSKIQGMRFEIVLVVCDTKAMYALVGTRTDGSATLNGRP